MGEVGFLQGTVEAIENGIGLYGAVAADITSNGIATPRFKDLRAEVDLQLTAEFAAADPESGISMPKFRTEFHLDWDLSGGLLSGGLKTLGSTPRVSFDNVSVGLGTLLSNSIGPVVKTIQQLSAPIQPVLDLLDAPIPGLSDVGAGKVNLLKLAKLAQSADALPPHLQLITKIALEVATLHAYVSRITIPGGEVYINLGDYNLTGKNGVADLRQVTDKAKSLSQFNWKGNLTDLKGLLVTGAKTFREQVEEILHQVPGAVQDQLRSLLDHSDFMNKLVGLNNGVKLSFPITEDPLNGAIKILLGQPSEVKFVEFTADLNTRVPTTELLNFPVWGPVRGNATGSIDVELHFGVRYDATGLRKFLERLHKQGVVDPKLFAHGLAIDSRTTNPLSNHSNDLINITANIGAGAYLPFPVGAVLPGPAGFPVTAEVRVGPNGSLSGTFGLRLTDPDGDGVVRPFDSSPSNRPEYLFEAEGKLDAAIKLLVEGWLGPVKLATLYERALLDKNLFDSKDIDKSNPFRPPAQWGFASFPTRAEIFHVQGNGGRPNGPPNDIAVRLNGDMIEVHVNEVRRAAYPRAETISLTIFGTRHDDNFVVRSIPVDVTVYGGPHIIGVSGFDTLTLDDRVPWLVPQMTYTVNSDRIRASYFTGDIENPREVFHSAINDIRLITPSRLNNINVNALPGVPFTIQTTPLYVSPRSGWNRLATYDPYDISSEFPSVNLITVNSSALNVNGASLTIDGRSSSDFLTLRENNSTLFTTYTVNTDRVIREVKDNELLPSRIGTVRFTGMETLDVVDNAPNTLSRTYRILGLSKALPVTITGGNGGDRFYIGGQQGGTIDPLSGPSLDQAPSLTVNGGGGFDRLIIDDTLNTDAESTDIDNVAHPTRVTQPRYTVNGTRIDRQNIVQDLVRNQTESFYFIMTHSGFEAVDISASGGSDEFTVAATLPGQTVSVFGWAGNDVLTAGQGVVDGLNGALTFFGGAGLDRLIVDDSFAGDNFFFGNMYLVQADRVTARFKNIGHNLVEEISLLTSGFDDLVSVQAVASDESVNVFSEAGNDYVVVGHDGSDFGGTGPGLTQILGPVSVNGGMGSDTLIVSDMGQSAAQSFGVTNNTVTANNSGAISYSEIEGLDVKSGSGGANFFVTGTSEGTLTNLYGHAGALDVFAIGFGADLNQILGPVRSWGQPDMDYAYYYEYLNPGSQSYQVTGNSQLGTMLIERLGIASVQYAGLWGVSFYAPFIGGNSLNVRSTPAGMQLGVAAGAGDTIRVSSSAPGTGGTVDNVAGHLFIGPGVAAGSTLIIDDTGNETSSRNVRLNRMDHVGIRYGTIEGLTPGGITFQDLGNWNIDLLGGSANESYSMRSTDFNASISIDGGSGVNTLDYSTPPAVLPGQVSWYRAEGNALDALNNNNGIPVHVGYQPGRNGQAFFFVGDDDYVRVPNSPTLEPIHISVEAWVKYDDGGPNSSYLVAKGQDANDQASYGFYLGDGLSFFVFDGQDSYAASPANGIIYDGEWHHLVGTYDGNAVRLYVDGAEIGEGTPASFPIGYNLSYSNDLFIGAGNDQLNFAGLIDDVSIFSRALTASEVQSRYTGEAGGNDSSPGVYVNLQTHAASGILGGVYNIDNVVGTSGNDILVGNGGNTLSGGNGRDLLIAGALASILMGGDGDDLLIGGTTQYDDNEQALTAIMTEWSRTDIDYADRLANLVNGNGVPVLDPSTVHRNGGANQLAGGLGQDLFFAQSALELLDLQTQQETWRPI